MTAAGLKIKAAERRLDIVNMVYGAKAGHIGGSLSSVDIICALYYRALDLAPGVPLNDQPGRDRFILSKGHSVEGYYAVLADIGFFPKEALASYQAFGSPFIGHPNRKVPGVEFSTGSLGHGLSLGAGVALAAKRGGAAYRAYVLMGDGE
ncbi:MAG: transketolase, partial [Defluviitaleaceae bacterium]|nr:transketolase [Defluviitaleaceae bacterium]